jgi:hypothetical protein
VLEAGDLRDKGVSNAASGGKQDGLRTRPRGNFSM